MELIDSENLQFEDSRINSSLDSLSRIFLSRQLISDPFRTKRKSIIVRDYENYTIPEIIDSFNLIKRLQFGINYVIEKEFSTPKRDLLMDDFTMIDESHFNVYDSGIGPLTTPKFSFYFRAYAPVAFCCFRRLYGIKPNDVQDSLCQNPLKKLSSTGKSGSAFYVSHDGKFILKTLHFREANFLMRLLPKYYLSKKKRIMAVIMNNLMPTNSDLDHIYDLKGSTLKRTVKENEQFSEKITHKDLDFLATHSSGLYIEDHIYCLIMEVVKRDCMVLESFNIIDYSLLLGIRNLDRRKRDRKYSEGPSMYEYEVETETVTSDPIRKEDFRNIHERMIRRKEIVDDVIHIFKPPKNEFFGINARNLKGEKLILYFGIIDILESYWCKKKLEYCWKSLIYDVKTISVQNPKKYSKRFRDFLGNGVFKVIPKYCFTVWYPTSARKSVITNAKNLNRIKAEKPGNEQSI